MQSFLLGQNTNTSKHIPASHSPTMLCLHIQRERCVKHLSHVHGYWFPPHTS
ncbi:hypothetical protein MdSGHV060 [Musca domestica salivary gland hypertrophy virus]|uniref:Uncharacterized protein n=1 Tax=Musca hytrovirus(isolate Musca domestica/United States/Boucias/-) TaxID=523909 RepID=B2YG37_MHVB|nr:hypothetical protein MdSGHV060 [Musca domestica salivary gland hypertrophy virus]ACD03519.1 hypothetical protein MdSGHV060 [Musca domestica salivary gland hypertrophy virus]